MHHPLVAYPFCDIAEREQGRAIRVPSQSRIGNIKKTGPALAEHVQDPVNIARHHNPVFLIQFSGIEGFDDFVPVQKGCDIRFGMDHLDVGQVHIINLLRLIGEKSLALPHQSGGFLINIF